MIDVSNNNGHVNWTLVRKQGHRIAAIKASEGDSARGGEYFDDAYFRYNMLGAQKNGILACPYYFAAPNWKAESQARHFLSICRAHIGKGHGKLILDIEKDYGRNGKGIQAWCEEFCSIVESVTHAPTIIYTYTAFTARLGKALITRPLWIANYTHTHSLPPNSWGEWPKKKIYAHQFTNEGSCAGIHGNVDLSYRFVRLNRFKMGGILNGA